MNNFEFERCIVRNVRMVEGSPVCQIENRDSLDRTDVAVVLSQTPEQITIPPIGSEVLVAKVKGIKVIFGVLQPPREEPSATPDIVSGVEEQQGSVSFTFGPRDGASEVEEFSIHHTSSGYEITADVDSTITLKTDGDIRLKAGGDIVIEQDGTPKPVLTEDATFEYEDTGDTSDGSATAETKTTTTVSNGETTDTKVD
jgi:hypothetical protein